MRYHRLLLIIFTIAAFKNFAGTPAQQRAVNDTAINYLFVEWRHWNNTVVLGHFSKNKQRRIAEKTFSIDEFNETVIRNWLKDDDKAALVSFHCMWGQQPWFHQKKYLSSFADVLAKGNNQKIKTVISVIWHAGGIFYRKNWNAAAAKGEPFGKLFSTINQYYHQNTVVFCHSMGSRFFQGVLRSMPAQENMFRAVIFFSADLPADINHPDFKLVRLATDSIAVFMHGKDKLLLLSSLVFHNKRLGRSGPLPGSEAIDMIVFDMTKKVKGFQNHTHINKKWTKEKLKEFLDAF